MSRIWELLNNHKTWIEFINYKKEQCKTNNEKINDLESYVVNREYVRVLEYLNTPEIMPFPKKRQISKMHNKKKRVIYIYPREINYLMKFITYLLIRKYDYLFEPNLYSFRTSTGVRKAIDYFKRIDGLGLLYSYKVDISNYFNSVDIELILFKLQHIMYDEIELFTFIKTMLQNPYVEWEGQIVCEEKGIMAGCPIASFLANVYLMDLDFYFNQNRIYYFRYSDDLIVFARTEQELEKYVGHIKSTLAELHLTINEKKELYCKPGEVWDFLGMEYCDGKFDISCIAKEKIKGKMRRKMHALLRWQRKTGVDSDTIVRVFIKRFNKKLFDNPVDSELTWARWYFPMINTTKSLAEIDHYMQDCIRYLATEKRTKRRYDFRYDDMKRLGYQSLVARYYLAYKEIDKCNQ